MSYKKRKRSDASSPEKQRVSKKTVATRAICLVLALLMVASSVYIILDILLH